MYNNKIAGITSDCSRLDNCIDCKVHDNVLFSYSGDHNSGEYEHGENGLQVGDGGVSHGYDARNAPTTTTNIEIQGNTFANNGLKSILLGSNSDNNVFIHDNKFIGEAELEQMGVPVEAMSGNVSYTNPPTKEMSENIFGYILDILSMNTTDVKTSQYHDQTKENISIVHENAVKNIDINHLINPIIFLFSGIVGVFGIAIFLLLKVII
jgi:hypothetical protein